MAEFQKSLFRFVRVRIQYLHIINASGLKGRRKAGYKNFPSPVAFISLCRKKFFVSTFKDFHDYTQV